MNRADSKLNPFTEAFFDRYYGLVKDLQRKEEEIIELKEKAARTTQTFSDMPKGKGTGEEQAKIWDKLIDEKELYLDMLIDVLHTHGEILEVITSIDEPILRLILHFRYIDLMSWDKVARTLGKNNTENSVRQRAKRFFEKMQNGDFLQTKPERTPRDFLIEARTKLEE